MTFIQSVNPTSLKSAKRGELKKKNLQRKTMIATIRVVKTCPSAQSLK